MCIYLYTHKDMHRYTDIHVRFGLIGKASFSLSRMVTIIYYKSSYGDMILLLVRWV